MSARVIENLRQTPLFKELPESELAKLADKAIERRLGENEVLFRRNDAGDALFMVHSGQLKIVTQGAQGEEVILNQCGPGEIIGEMSLLDEEPRSAGAVALSEVTLYELKREDFLEAMDEQPRLAAHIIRNLSSRLRFSTTYIEKAIDWSQRIAAGDYGQAMDQIQDSQAGSENSKEARAARLLSAFFKMVKNVKAREDDLKEQLQKLTVEIDEARRKQEYEELTQSEFFSDLKAKAAEMRRKRLENS